MKILTNSAIALILLLSPLARADVDLGYRWDHKGPVAICKSKADAVVDKAYCEITVGFKFEFTKSSNGNVTCVMFEPDGNFKIRSVDPSFCEKQVADSR